jgi:ferritin
MISKKTEQALNKHLSYELEASLQYLAMASWCEDKGMEGSANFFYGHSAEENAHFIMMFKFINEVNGRALVPAVNQPKADFNSIQEICQIAYENEQNVTRAIHELVEISKQENDLVVTEFLRFFVEEQKEEETLYQKILDRIKLIGDGPQSLYYIDKELERFGKKAAAAESGNASA